VAPLAHASLENALALGVMGLTGPISRGDVETVRQHIAALDGQPMLDTYRALGRATVDNALRHKRITAEVAADIRTVLS
jgi:predicted short-subunit dehydrogenase-like oxidoreductase (DUF2520 family)